MLLIEIRSQETKAADVTDIRKTADVSRVVVDLTSSQCRELLGTVGPATWMQLDMDRHMSPDLTDCMVSIGTFEAAEPLLTMIHAVHPQRGQGVESTITLLAQVLAVH